jgi:DNA polymerase II small subunit/DNA polymerase delta subunit B
MWHTQFEKMPYSIKTIRDYAERTNPAMNNEAQINSFGNPRSLSIKGSSVYSYDGESLRQFELGLISQEELIQWKVFMLHLSDKSEQDSSTTYANMKKEYQNKEALGELVREKTIDMNNTDGCTGQYHSFRALFMTSLLARNFSIIIDRAVGAPGHGKDEVDGLNAVDKRLLQSKMCHTEIAGEEDNERKMKPNAMMETENFSLAEECHQILQDPSRIKGV